MHWISTALAIAFGLLSTAAALWCHARALEAAQHASRLATLRGRVLALEAGFESLHTAHRKLSGRFYATQANSSETVERPTPAYEGAVCENYAIAQFEGPRSTAASCQCDYCTAKRAERAATRAALVPRTAAAQGALAKRNAGQE